MKRLLLVLITIVVAVSLGLLLRAYCVTAVRVAGTSMAGTLESGDIVLVTKLESLFDGIPERGSVIQCRFGDRSGLYLKRVIGLPGETVSAIDGLIYIDGRPYPEMYPTSETEDFACAVPEGHVFVLGDNRAESYDSRAEDMGCVRIKDVLGTVRMRLYPPARFGRVGTE